MANKFCQFCGSAMDEGSNFCQACGKSQTTQSAPPTTSSYSAPSSNYSSPAPAYSQPSTSYQSTYAAPYSGYNALQAAKDVPLTVGQYIGMFIVSGIPLIGFIMLLVWSFGGDTNTNKKNYARAVLIIGIIGGVLAGIFSAVLVPLIMNAINNAAGGQFF